MRHILEQGRYDLQVEIPFGLQNFSSHVWGTDGKETEPALCLPISRGDAIHHMISKPFTFSFDFFSLLSPFPNYSFVLVHKNF